MTYTQEIKQKIEIVSEGSQILELADKNLKEDAELSLSHIYKISDTSKAINQKAI